MKWSTGEVLGWGEGCSLPCFPSISAQKPHSELEIAKPVTSHGSPGSTPSPSAPDLDFPDLSGVPPRHRRLYSLSAPERDAMENYINSSLAAGIICPSSSPARAGFFFDTASLH